MRCSKLLHKKLSFLVDVVERPVTMTTPLNEQAWQSGLVLLDETPEWNTDDWPPLEGGWRIHHASVVLDHLDTENDSNNRGQTVVVLGGYQQGQGITDSVLVLNLVDSNKQWREGPSMNKKRSGHAAVVCNGGVYVMGGSNAGSSFDHIEQIDSNDLLRSSLRTTTTQDSHWTTLTCRLSMGRSGCCAAAVNNRFIVVVGGYNGGYNDGYLSSVDIIDTSNHTVTAGPSMAVPRLLCANAVIGCRIFVVGGRNEHGYVDSVEYLDGTTPCDSDETEKETGSTFISFSPTWTTHSELMLSNGRSSCAVVTVGSCLVVVGGRGNLRVEVFDTHHNRVWNLPPFGNHREDCSTVTVANKVAVISGWGSPTCATLPLLDKHTWCFRRLYEQQIDRWCLFREGRNIQHADNSPFPTWTSDRKRARPHTHRGDEGKDGT